MVDARITSGHDDGGGVHNLSTVTTGLDPVVQTSSRTTRTVDARIKSGHDGGGGVHNLSTVTTGLDPVVRPHPLSLASSPPGLTRWSRLHHGHAHHGCPDQVRA